MQLSFSLQLPKDKKLADMTNLGQVFNSIGGRMYATCSTTERPILELKTRLKTTFRFFQIKLIVFTNFHAVSNKP